MNIMTTRTLFFNCISTGCSCCSNENFCEGPFETLGGALASALSHRKHSTLSSQFSPNGEQNTYQAPCRVIDTPSGSITLIPGNFYSEGDETIRFPENLTYGEGFEYLGPA